MPDAPMPPEYYNFLDAFKKRYAQAEALAAQKKFSDALKAFQACLDFSAQQHTPLLIDQFVDLWMRMAFCHADLNRPGEALRVYHILEAVLKHWVEAVHSGQAIDDWMRAHNAEVDWQNLVPEGVTFVIPQSFDPRPALAAVYESMGLAHDNAGHPEDALAAYQQAIEWHTQLGQLARAAQTWKYRAGGCQRRQEWPALQHAAEGMLAAYQSLGDLNGLLDSYTLLFLAALNQRDVLGAIDNLRHAIDLEREANHPFLTRDEKTLGDLLANLRRAATGGKPAAKPLPAALLQPSGWPGLIEKVTAHVSAEKSGRPLLLFTLHTPRFDEALALLRALRLSVVPLGVSQLLALPELPDFDLPADAALLIHFTLEDVAALTPLASLVLDKAQLAPLAHANLAARGFSVALEGPGGGRLAKPHSETFRFEPYVLDWEGWAGVATWVRLRWGHEPEARESVREALLNRLRRGPAAELNNEVGFTHRLQEEWDEAILWYQQEVRAHLRPDGRLEWGAARALCNLGVVYKKRGEAERARECFQLALHLNPNHYEALVGAVGLLPDLAAILPGLSRLQRLRPDDEMLATLLNDLCGEAALAAEELARLVRAASADVDLTAPFAPLAVDDPAALLKKLMAETFVAAPSAPPPSAPPPEPDFNTTAPLQSLDEVRRALRHFAIAHAGLSAPNVRLEAMTEYRKDTRGQMTTSLTPGVVWQLSANPELILRVTLTADECVVRLMQELPLPGAAEAALKAMRSEHLPARGDALLDVLNAWVAEGVLVKHGGQFRYGGASK